MNRSNPTHPEWTVPAPARSRAVPVAAWLAGLLACAVLALAPRASATAAPVGDPALAQAVMPANPLREAPADSVRPVPPADGARDERATGAQGGADTLGVEYLWVLRNSLVDPADIPRLVARAKAMRVRGLLVQVVGRGDGWYRSDLLPYPEPLRAAGRDPLGELLPLAHAAGLEVHAWMNCCLVWSGPRLPRDPRHVIRAHPEWIARMANGTPMTRLTPAEREELMVEGVFLSPGHPNVRHWIAGIAREIASRYPVDGIHLDYIRQPSVLIGFDPTTRARFALEHGADPDPANPRDPFHRLPPEERAAMNAAWADFQGEQVTAIVREVRDSLDAVRTGIVLSAAVLADSLTAARRNRQEWSRWVRDGLLDRAFVMCYAPVVQTVLRQLSAMASWAGAARVVPGIAVYNTSPATAAAKIKGAHALGFPAVALYSYDSLWERDGLWARLHDFLNGPSTLEARP